MILVTGASGTMGKAVLNEVAKSGTPHRAMYRSATEAAKAPAGTSTVSADFGKKDTLPAALEGISSVYVVCSPIPQLIELEWNMIDACVAAGVGHI
ncbi:MAG TPA: NmrA family NAD(P)-binding protein, partial [Candidatus Acidoferrum sp.]